MRTPNLVLPGIATDTMGLCVSTRLTPEIIKTALAVDTFVVVKGVNARKAVRELRRHGVEVPIVIDPAQYEPRIALKSNARRDGWHELHREGGAPLQVSPGCLLTLDNRDRWAELIEQETAWCRESGQMPFASVCIESKALVKATQELIDHLAGLAFPCWITLAASNDPLGRKGAVHALCELLYFLPDAMLMRTDFASVGGAAIGKRITAFGATATVRFASMGGGGGRLVNSPSVFVNTIDDWKKPEMLLAWTQRDPDIERDLICYESCCEGHPVTRFADPQLYEDINQHNFLAMRACHDLVVALPDMERRLAKVQAMAGHASFQADRLADSIPGIKLSAQIRQWRDLGFDPS